MVHLFKKLDNRFVFDTDSGSIFVLDELSHLLLKERLGGSYAPDRAERARLSSYPEAERAEAEAEIDALIGSGALFTRSQPRSFDGSGPVKALCLNVCHDCNLVCGYCFADGGVYGGGKERMSAEVARASVDFLARNGEENLEIDFFGGEPLLNLSVIRDTIAYARKNYSDRVFKFTITTNGLLLDGDTAAYLNGVMQNVVISIDGRKAVNDAVRRARPGGDFHGDCFDTILENARRFRGIRGGADYFIRGTYTRKNLDFASDAEFLFREGFDSVSLEPAVLPLGHPLAIREADIPAIDREYERLALIMPRYPGARFFHFGVDFSGGPCEQRRLSACSAGCRYYCVSPAGRLHPCHQFASDPAFGLGSVTDGVTAAGLHDEFSLLSVLSKPECQTCFAKYHCSGGCAAAAYRSTGSLYKPDRIQCGIIRARLETALAYNAGKATERA